MSFFRYKDIMFSDDFPIRHGFLDKNLSQYFRTDHKKLCSELGVDDVLFLNQEHTANCHYENDMDFKSSCDAIITSYDNSNPRQIALALYTADCLPIIIANENFVALVHAGWKGLSQGIVESTIEKLKAKCSIENCKAIIGPAAGSLSYEVGIEVIDSFKKPPVCVAATEEGKFLLDLPSTCKIILNTLGIQDVQLTDICTIHDERFNSYRRESSDAGRNVSFVVV